MDKYPLLQQQQWQTGQRRTQPLDRQTTERISMKPPRVRQQESGDGCIVLRRSRKEHCKQQDDQQLLAGRRTGVSSCILLLLLLLAVGDSMPSGTVNGYDNEGGTDPICWDSTVYWENAQMVRLTKTMDAPHKQPARF
jgi:hypothetical protein